MKYVLEIDGMSCKNCVAHVKKALQGISYVENVKVELDTKTATFESDKEVSKSQLEQIIDDEGYVLLDFKVETKN